MNTAATEQTSGNSINLVRRMMEIDIDNSAFKKESLEPVGKGEKVVGTLSDDLRRLYIVRNVMLSEATVLENDLKKRELKHVLAHFDSDSVHDCKEHNEGIDKDTGKLLSLLVECKIADSIFWNMLSLEMPGTRNSDLDMGIREGFQVVLFRDRQREERTLASIRDIVMKLFRS